MQTFLNEPRIAPEETMYGTLRRDGDGDCCRGKAGPRSVYCRRTFWRELIVYPRCTFCSLHNDLGPVKRKSSCLAKFMNVGHTGYIARIVVSAKEMEMEMVMVMVMGVSDTQHSITVGLLLHEHHYRKVHGRAGRASCYHHGFQGYASLIPPDRSLPVREAHQYFPAFWH